MEPRNVKQLLRQWEAEELTIDKNTFKNVTELARFIVHAKDSLDKSDFEILMEDLISI